MDGFRNFATQSQPVAQTKLWHMTKPEIVQYWQSLRSDVPIMFTPIDKDKRGSTFSDDGIRITGSRRFIDSILGRIKDFIQWENPKTKLNVAYQQTRYRDTGVPENGMSFAFYAQVQERSKQLGVQPGTHTTPARNKNP